MRNPTKFCIFSYGYCFTIGHGKFRSHRPSHGSCYSFPHGWIAVNFCRWVRPYSRHDHYRYLHRCKRRDSRRYKVYDMPPREFPLRASPHCSWRILGLCWREISPTMCTRRARCKWQRSLRENAYQLERKRMRWGEHTVEPEVDLVFLRYHSP